MIYTNTLSNNGIAHDIKICGIQIHSSILYVIGYHIVPKLNEKMDCLSLQFIYKFEYIDSCSFLNTLCYGIIAKCKILKMHLIV